MNYGNKLMFLVLRFADIMSLFLHTSDDSKEPDKNMDHQKYVQFSENIWLQEEEADLTESWIEYISHSITVKIFDQHCKDL